LINVNVYVPESLNEKERKWMEDMKQSENFVPSASARKSVFNKFKKMFD